MPKLETIYFFRPRFISFSSKKRRSGFKQAPYRAFNSISTQPSSGHIPIRNTIGILWHDMGRRALTLCLLPRNTLSATTESVWSRPRTVPTCSPASAWVCRALSASKRTPSPRSRSGRGQGSVPSILLRVTIARCGRTDVIVRSPLCPSARGDQNG